MKEFTSPLARGGAPRTGFAGLGALRGDLPPQTEVGAQRRVGGLEP
jgi:hypothetical protein